MTEAYFRQCRISASPEDEKLSEKNRGADGKRLMGTDGRQSDEGRTGRNEKHGNYGIGDYNQICHETGECGADERIGETSG